MRKGVRTRSMIIKRTAELLNQKGYLYSTIQDVMRETGLEKGGIYNHFKSKEELTFLSFDYAAQLVTSRFMEALANKTGGIERLRTFVDTFFSFLHDPPIPGGCPIMNVAIESDNAHQSLRDKARDFMDSWLSEIRDAVKIGIKNGEIRPEIQPNDVATLIVCSLEGALMLTQLYQNGSYLKQSVVHLQNYIDSIQSNI